MWPPNAATSRACARCSIQNPTLVARGDRAGGTPLHRAVIGRASNVVTLVLDRGADIHAIHGAGLGSSSGYAPEDLQAIDLAIWGGPCRVRSLRAFVAGVSDVLHERFTSSRRVHDLATARLLISRGATYDLTVAAALGDIDHVTAMLGADATRRGNRKLLTRLLDAGVRMPPVAGGCQSYVMERPDMLRVLLARGGLSPDYPTPEGVTLLHTLCSRDVRGRTMKHRTRCAAILLDAGANISAKDDEYRSTPLAWAARNNLPDMVDFLLARGAPTNLPDDETWATPLAWAERRGHKDIAGILRRHGAR